MKISVKHLSIKYRDHYGIKDVNCEISQGRFIALIGHNGSGKSSFCNALVGLLRPSEGMVSIQGLPEHQQNFSSIGFAPQSQVVDWYTNVKTNVMLGTQLAHLMPEKAEQQIDLILDLLDLTDLSHSKLTELSGGQLQRVQIARALVHQPLIYILDEPTVGLDAQNTDRLMKYLKQEANKGKIVIVSSHDLFLLEEYAEELILLDEGNLIYHGSMKNLLQAKNESRQYILTFDRNYTSAEYFLVENSQIITSKHLEDNIWQLEVERSMTVSDVMRKLKKNVKVLNFVEHEKTLKEVYLSMSKRGGTHASDRV
ncbi:ABC transporter ATP-binding protein [Atopobacter sp. AH10]|uniref:metal ABC transporter ATP-binding protein n=1 Tax=Atopobacter sp. AH10 TaxID=2315861 RepID=UPI000EF20399|nr:ABC transporter ATP-binding protein [Atopobacter sp. AH10]RLK63803.1 ABC transporter ATP-binding protein [Atopobacter sp. AH10]